MKTKKDEIERIKNQILIKMSTKDDWSVDDSLEFIYEEIDKQFQKKIDDIKKLINRDINEHEKLRDNFKEEWLSTHNKFSKGLYFGMNKLINKLEELEKILKEVK